jgi:hypothetical protein
MVWVWAFLPVKREVEPNLGWLNDSHYPQKGLKTGVFDICYLERGGKRGGIKVEHRTFNVQHSTSR